MDSEQFKGADLFRRNHPMTERETANYMSECGFSLTEITAKLGYEPPRDWLWHCAFCAKHQR